LEALLSRALRLTANRLLGGDAPGDAEDPAWLLVDAAPVALSVDERGVTDPLGFRGRELGAMVFAALAPADTIVTWRAVAQGLEFSALTLAAAPLAVAAGVSQPQALLVDVGGVTTDLTWCQAGCPVALASVAQGGVDLTRALLRKWRITPDKAERLKRAYANGRLSAEAREQVLEVLAPTLQGWLQAAEAALTGLNQDQPLPSRLYVLGGGGSVPAVRETLRALAWSRRLHFARYPEVGRLEPTDVPGVVNRTEFGREGGDVTALALAAWAARQSQAPGRPDQILAALCQG
jgi:hypothetical protein